MWGTERSPETKGNTYMGKYPNLVDIDANEYHKAARDGKYLSSHLLGDFRKAPRLYKRKMTGEIEPADSAALMLGRAVHTLVLEGRAKFDAEFMISDGPVNPKTGEPFGKVTKAYREWAAAQKLPVVSGPDFSFMSKLQQAVWCHPVAGRLLEFGVSEKTLRTAYCGEMCQIRMDWFREDYEGRPIICDLKTCDSIDHFENDSWRFGYPHQMAFYREVFATGTDGTRPDCYLIAVEKKEPYRVAVYKLTDDLLDQCVRQNEAAIDELHVCRKTNVWPTRTEDLRILDV